METSVAKEGVHTLRWSSSRSKWRRRPFFALRCDASRILCGWGVRKFRSQFNKISCDGVSQIPFRDAHNMSGQCVALAEKYKCQLPDVALEDFKKIWWACIHLLKVAQRETEHVHWFRKGGTYNWRCQFPFETVACCIAALFWVFFDHKTLF